MKKLIRFAIALAFVPVLFLSSCKEDAPDAVNAYVTLKSYMVTNNLDLPALATSWIVDPKSTGMGGIVDSVNGTLPGYTIFDLRSASDFAAGHIKDATNVVLKDIITKVTTTAVAKDAKILVVCYTGQTAGQAVMALRLLGWKNAVVLKWGMAGWNATYKGPWVSNSGVEVAANGEFMGGPGRVAQVDGHGDGLVGGDFEGCRLLVGISGGLHNLDALVLPRQLAGQEQIHIQVPLTVEIDGIAILRLAFHAGAGATPKRIIGGAEAAWPFRSGTQRHVVEDHAIVRVLLGENVVIEGSLIEIGVLGLGLPFEEMAGEFEHVVGVAGFGWAGTDIF